ncbi:MAG: DUF445 domain-containing protein [Paraburkholderia sp.]|jgi:uncharacterized membrane-anchored protein YjiN (DUF445 family)|uniref:DUF445 domain-containing protein n=3 Tax=Burkholderiales TaxID=80840 RepID=UPI0010F64859|nr:DUF445 domain-containing protein [Burkholderia sp. 4M9327F10]
MASDSSVDSPAQFAINERRAQLKQMRLFAGGLLLMMLVLFIAASVLRSRWPWLVYVHAFTEAAMVGACADWFAVVSLFRHPFGVPLPHTAVIAKHKVRIAENFGAFVSSNFLMPAEVAAKLESIDAAGWAARWIRESDNARQVAKRLQHLFPSLLELAGERSVREYGRGLIRNGIDSIAAAPLAARLLSVLIAHGHHETAFNIALDQAQRFIDEHKDRIRQNVANNTARWVRGWVDGRITDAFLVELQRTLDEARATADHPWRIEYRTTLEELTVRLADDPQLLEQGERIKSEVLDNDVVEGYLEWLSGEVGEKVQAEIGTDDGMLMQCLEHGLRAVGGWLEDNPEVRATINRWAQQLVLNAIVPNRKEIGAFISEVIARWDTTTLIDKLELQVGKDLQYIRINGTLIGGLVGLGIFMVDRLFA